MLTEYTLLAGRLYVSGACAVIAVPALNSHFEAACRVLSVTFVNTALHVGVLPDVGLVAKVGPASSI